MTNKKYMKCVSEITKSVQQLLNEIRSFSINIKFVNDKIEDSSQKLQKLESACDNVFEIVP
jgi:septation ring formation regulator EzrA